MPTRENCQQFESLMDAVGALVETRRVVDKTQHEINVLKARLGIRATEGAEETGERDITPMDVDETGGNGEQDAEGEPDDERAQSVVSTRSGRSRKHVGDLNLRTSGCSLFKPSVNRAGVGDPCQSHLLILLRRFRQGLAPRDTKEKM
jgi:hypothetical protein